EVEPAVVRHVVGPAEVAHRPDHRVQRLRLPVVAPARARRPAVLLDVDRDPAWDPGALREAAQRAHRVDHRVALAAGGVGRWEERARVGVESDPGERGPEPPPALVADRVPEALVLDG